MHQVNLVFRKSKQLSIETNISTFILSSLKSNLVDNQDPYFLYDSQICILPFTACSCGHTIKVLW